ncbi:MAG: hypothetical protein H6872_11400 [Methylobacteriaceae bacterium]|nr:hypothetical protein [Rhodoblastus sp.]MCC0005714.1 hypothetical protein [Methylobacteriaceae bacterium]
MNAYSLAFTPLVAPWLMIALALCGALVVALALYARRPGAWLRALGLALMLLALGDPSFVREDREPLKDTVALVLDTSGSQSIAERPKQIAAARAELEKRFGALGNVDLRVIESGRSEAEADGTKLFSALNAGLADVPTERLGAVVMVTDGVVHDAPETVQKLGFKAPLHVLTTGHEGERDRRIELVEAPRFGIVGKTLTLEARVVDPGGRAPVLLRVRRDGAEVARVRGLPDETLQIPVVIEHGGPNVVELEVDTVPGELTAINNKAVVTVDGVRDKLKVLLVSGQPHNGERMWRNLLRSDANVELVHFTILRPPEKQDGTPINELSLIAFPTADLFGRKIKEFDLIIFDRYSNQSVLPSIYLDNMVRYVNEGGAMLLAAGPDFATAEGIFFSPLGRIAPARPTGDLVERAFRARVSEAGKKHPVTRGLPGAEADPPRWSDWFRQVNVTATRGQSVLTGASDRPLLVLSREGKGRVAELLTDQMWLWARGYEGGGPYLEILRRLAHWLMKEPDLEEEILRASAHGKQLRIERQTLKDRIEPVTIVAPSGATDQVTLAPTEPGLARGTYAARELGLYKLTEGDLTALVNVGPANPREFQDVISSQDRLREIALASGGTIRRIAANEGRDVSGALTLPRVASVGPGSMAGGADWIGVRRTDSHVVRGVGVSPLALGLSGLAVLLAAFVAAWLAEGRRRA